MVLWLVACGPGLSGYDPYEDQLLPRKPVLPRVVAQAMKVFYQEETADSIALTDRDGI